MWLIIITIVVLVLLTVLLLTRAMSVPRDSSREHPDTPASIIAYHHVSRWPIFYLERAVILNALSKRVPSGIMVDIGSGPGYLAADINQKYRGLKIVGLDNSILAETLAKQAWHKEINGLEFVIADAHRLPVASASLDFVVSSLSLHHWENASTVFDEIMRALKPGGQFLIFDLRRDAPAYFYYALVIGQAIFAPRAIKNTNGAIGSFWAAYTPAEINAILSKMPLQDIQIKPSFGWMLISGTKSE
jgi:ubiquinone/menaquinone biosynthesis C-methylase UbiE